MKEKKKKIDFVWMIFVILFIGIGYMFYNSLISDTINKKSFFEFDNTIEKGIVKVYNDDDIKKFKNKAIAMQDKMVAAGLKPGIYLSQHEEELNDFIGQAYDDLGLDHVSDEQIRYETLLDVSPYKSNNTFKDNNILFNEVFDKQFNLKKPFIFYGVTSVGESVRDYNTEPYYEYMRPKFANEFVPALKYYDSKYKDSDGSSMSNIIKQAVLGGTTAFIFDNLSLDRNMNNSPIYRESIEKYNNGQKMTSILPLITYLNMKPTYFNFFNDIPTKNYPSYKPFPDEYNYFKENNNYFTIYYPTSIEKIDSKTYVVNITVEDPITPEGSSYICREVAAHFFNSKFPHSEYENYDDIPLLLCIKINNKDNLNNGILYDYPYICVSNNVSRFNMELSSQYNNNYGKAEWYPNEEAQVWVKDFFDKLSVALEQNTNFSIFDTIKEISEKYEKEYNDVENVILSYYWAHII